jgi:nucleotide-binding universal stress UspA family protein
MKILVGYDGSDVAMEALKLAQEHASILAAKLEVVRTMPQSHELKYQDIQKAEHKLKNEVKYLLKGNSVPYEARVLLTGRSSGEELVEFAKRNEIDEIIIGVRRKSKVGKLIFGSTAQYVILNAPCPVLTIK